MVRVIVKSLVVMHQFGESWKAWFIVAKQLSRQDSNFTQVFQNARRVAVLRSAYLK